MSYNGGVCAKCELFDARKPQRMHNGHVSANARTRSSIWWYLFFSLDKWTATELPAILITDHTAAVPRTTRTNKMNSFYTSMVRPVPVMFSAKMNRTQNALYGIACLPVSVDSPAIFRMMEYTRTYSQLARLSFGDLIKRNNKECIR